MELGNAFDKGPLEIFENLVLLKRDVIIWF